MKATVAEVILAELSAWGVRNIYGYAGDSILRFLAAIERQDQIKYFSTRHEAAAGFMASAEAKMFGRLGVCLAHAGPGTANLLTGLADAYADRAPVLAITGQVDTIQIGTDYKQYIDQQALVQPVASFSALLANARATVDVLTRAIRIALSQGTVAHIAVPKDLFTQEIEVDIRLPEPFLTAYPAQSEQYLNEATAVLNESVRPMILLGRGGRGHGEAILALAERWGAGVITTMPAKGAVPGDHRLVVGGLGEGGSEAASDLLWEADTLLVLGATWWPAAYTPPRIKIVQIDADPAAIGRHTPVHYGYVGELGQTLPRLQQKIAPADRSAWAARIEDKRRRWLARVMEETSRVTQPLAPQYVVDRLENALAPDAVIALDVGDFVLWFNRIFAGAGHEVLTSGNWRAVGFGLPAAIQAQLNQMHRQVVALIGDGGLNMSLAEFATAVQYEAPVKVIVFNNGCLAMERNRMLAGGISDFGTNLANPDFAAFAEACGGRGYRVTTPEETAPVFSRALSDRRPCIIDVAVEPAVIPTVTPV